MLQCCEWSLLPPRPGPDPAPGLGALSPGPVIRVYSHKSSDGMSKGLLACSDPGI